MRKILTIALLILAGTAWGQLTVTGTIPADGATNVPLTTTLAIAFSTPIDTTTAFQGKEQNVLTNIPEATNMWYSAAQDTVYFLVNLSPNTAYFAGIYSLKSKTGGQVMQIPVGVRFTTGSSFPPYSISGTVLQGATSVSPANALVVISSTPFTDKPTFVMGTIADGSGSFTMPDVANGTYYVAAAKDVVLDGQIDPSLGDVVGFGPTTVVNNANVTGMTIVFMEFPPVTWSAALDSVAQHIGSLPSDRSLRFVNCWSADSLGRTSDGWQFSYASPSNPGAPAAIEVGTMGTRIRTITEPNNINWIENTLTQLPSLSGAASADSFVAKVERAGGLAYRNQIKPGLRFLRSLSLGRLAYSGFWRVPGLNVDTHYWGAEYRWAQQVNDSTTVDVYKEMYVGNFTNGSIIGTAGIKDNGSSEVPDAFSLGQNYPNPFNPSTQIGYAIASQSHVKIEVFNLLGQKVATLVDKEMAGGTYTVEWTAKVSSGIYLYRMEANPSAPGSHRFVQTRKLVLLQ
jgi:hypothetical protein